MSSKRPARSSSSASRSSSSSLSSPMREREAAPGSAEEGVKPGVRCLRGRQMRVAAVERSRTEGTGFLSERHKLQVHTMGQRRVTIQAGSELNHTK